MKKRIVFLALVIVLGIAGMPVLSGMIAEKRVRQSFEDANLSNRASGSGARVDIIRYDRGLFSSEIEWKIVSGILENIFGVSEIIFVDRAGHGLTGIVTATSLEKNQWFADFINQKLKGKNPLSIKTEFNSSGRIKSMLVLDAVSFTDGSHTFNIGSGRADFSIDRSRDPIPLNIKMQGRLDSLQSGGREIKNASAGLHINHPDAEAVWQTMQKQMAEKGFEWIEICEKLLKKGFEIEVLGLRAQLPEGDMEADGRLRLEKDLPLTGLISLIMAPSKALDYISLKSDINLPKNPDLDDRMLLSPLYPGMQTGLFIMEKDRLIHSAETREGKLFLNEKEVSIK